MKNKSPATTPAAYDTEIKMPAILAAIGISSVPTNQNTNAVIIPTKIERMIRFTTIRAPLGYIMSIPHLTTG